MAIAEPFTPYRPRPTEVRKGIRHVVSSARKNLLTIFNEESYSADFVATKILGRKIYVANRPDLVRHILLKNHKNYEPKSPQMRRALELLLGDGLFISDGPTWAIRRPLVSPIIHNKNLHLFADTMVETAQEMVDELTATPEGRSVDMVDISARLTATIICRTVFGRNLPREDAQKIIDGFAAYQKHIDVVNLPYFLGIDNGLPVFRGFALRRATNAVRGTISKIIEDVSQRHSEGDDRSMIHMLLDARTPDGEPLTRDAIVNEAATLFMAGYETTATTLAWAHYLLSADAASEARLHAELETVLGNRQPTLEDVPKLTFARAVIDETLRLYPPVPFLLRQAVSDDQIEDISIPAKSLVGVVPWLLHRNPELWDQPDAFVPDRFVGKSATPFSYIPFAMGPRICAGVSFGITESVLCLAVFARHLQFRVAQGHNVEPVCHLTLKPGGGLPMTVERRQT
ncbi:MAG: cytochrome P450 [Pseudomonadota bacterium]